jgi:hypothetical protein
MSATRMIGVAGATTAVCVEVGHKRVFASALEWPGWSRSAKTEDGALEALAAYAERYAIVADRAGVEFPAPAAFDVVERLTGSGATDFGVPEAAAVAETQPTTAAAARRLAALVTGAWSVFDEVSAASPAELRKGPRGGGRDRDKMIGHVLEAEAAYARKLGLKLDPPALGDLTAIEELREAIAAVLAAPSDGAPLVPKGWTVRYAARRVAWHVLDHAWEMADRAEPEK